MDRNSAIGFTLIAALILVYLYWFSPTPAPPTPQKEIPQTSGNTAPDSLKQTPVISDSVLAATYGELASVLKGEESSHTVETADLKITFTSKGGIIKELELKNYQTYDKQPLKLISPGNNEFKLTTRYRGQDLDLYQLFYKSEQSKKADTTILSFSAAVSGGSIITQTYMIPDKGFEIKYGIRAQGLQQEFAGENLVFDWNSNIRLMEKDVKDSRTNSTINFFDASEGFDNLSATSTGTETEVLANPIQWVSIKQKFFLSSIIAKENFPGGEIQTSLNENDPTLVKITKIKLNIPKKSLNETQPGFKFYFGPNDYQVIGNVADKFAKNVYLGWPPVYWINKFIIFPVFHFLTQIFSNYGIIIVILVILLKLVLFPLSYKSYLSMAKMKVLKPELDEIKERVGEDMTKVQQEQMKLYQQVGVNPISGCIPVLLQMPILFAMFYLFPASIELRQQPLLWAEDLSTYDSIINFGLAIPFLGSHISLFTVLMTASTLIYTWQNNQISSVQGPMKSMSYIMPLIFFFVLNSFSAGLTFYYLVSNLVTFAQQAIIKRFVDENKIRAIMDENRKKNAAGGGKKSAFLSKLEDAMKASEETRKKAEEERKRKKGGK
jgi:YidC/Oxa1 family membrane protein insertase